jgi:hypothetical protein
MNHNCGYPTNRLLPWPSSAAANVSQRCDTNESDCSDIRVVHVAVFWRFFGVGFLDVFWMFFETG